LVEAAKKQAEAEKATEDNSKLAQEARESIPRSRCLLPLSMVRSSWFPGKRGADSATYAPWFFAQDGGFYVRCRYGFRYLHFQDDNNALFVRDLHDVGSALNALAAAAENGELEEAIAQSIVRGRQ